MLTLDDLDTIRIHTEQDIRPAALRFADIVTAEFDFLIGGSHDLYGPMVTPEGETLAHLFGWPDHGDQSWWRSSVERILDAPIRTACRYESEPFWINAQGVYTTTRNGFLTGLPTADFARYARVGAFIVVPVHLPFAQIGNIVYASRDPAVTDLSNVFVAQGHMLGLYGRTFLSDYIKVTLRPLQSPPLRLSLTRRELEILRWAALGKTDEEISLIMSISRSTIRFHTRNAIDKLDAANRGHAVFKAASLGLLGLASWSR